MHGYDDVDTISSSVVQKVYYSGAFLNVKQAHDRVWSELLWQLKGTRSDLEYYFSDRYFQFQIVVSILGPSSHIEYQQTYQPIQ